MASSASIFQGSFSIRFDFPGQLLNPGQAPDKLLDHARHVSGLFEKLGISAAHLVGASFGALVAVELAAAFPTLARSLVAITAADRATEKMTEAGVRMRQLAAAVISGQSPDEFQALLLQDVYSSSYQKKHADELSARTAIFHRMPTSWFEGLDGILASVEGYDVRAAAGRVQCPSLVLAAAADAIMPLDGVRELSRILNADIQEHPTSGHALVVEDPAWVAEHCLDFLDRVEKESTAIEEETT
jgi:pimeloyl-ACP methyl ester carboxylesterase